MSAHQVLEQLVFPTRDRGLSEALHARMRQHPPGVVAVLTREVGTFKDFIFDYRQLVVPPGSGETSLSGGEKVASRNAAAAALLANAQCEWLYQLDDDHAFTPTVLLDQLDVMAAEDLDVVGVLYVARLAPPSHPIGGIFTRDADGRLRVRDLEWSDLPDHGHVLERRDLCLGTSGLLVRRRVFDTLEAPYFQVGQIRPEKEHEDLHFTIRCQDAGLKVGLWLGPAAPGFVGLGHVCRCTLWPQRHGDGSWGIGVAMDQRVDAPRLAAASPIVVPNDGNRHERRAAAARAPRPVGRSGMGGR